MPKASVEYQFYKILCGRYEAYAYSQSGSVSDKSEEGFKTKIIHYKKARAIYKLFGMNDDVSRMDTIILLQTEEYQYYKMMCGTYEAFAYTIGENVVGGN